MLDCKIKSLLKYVCFVVSAVVIIYYFGGKRSEFLGNPVKSEMSSLRILSAEFEVFGIVQGVFFRKNTEEAAKRLGVRGWCMNTRDDTVKGEIQGEVGPFNEMKEWLTKTGSPQSRIDKAVFSQPKELSEFTFATFEIRRVKK